MNKELVKECTKKMFWIDYSDMIGSICLVVKNNFRGPEAVIYTRMKGTEKEFYGTALKEFHNEIKNKPIMGLFTEESKTKCGDSVDARVIAIPIEICREILTMLWERQ